MIYDCFSFFGSESELDLLELKLNELSSVVDKFVIVEANLTHSGKPKSLNYQQNRERFTKFASKILYIIVEDMPTTPEQIQKAITPQDRKWLDTGYQLGDNWVRERYQRNQIMRGLTQCLPDDIIIIEDADEFVKAEILEHIHETIVDGSNAVEQTLNTYFMDWQCTNMKWSGSKILKYKFISSPSEDRFHTPASGFILNGGNHYGFLGGANAIKQKLVSYAHDEYSVPEVLDNVAPLLMQKKDALGRLYQYEVIELNKENTPKYVLDHPEIYNKYMWRNN